MNSKFGFFIICIILAVVFSFTSCNKGNNDYTELDETTTNRESSFAEFLPIDKGKEELKKVFFINSRWNLESRGNYIFASNYDYPYILRYNISKNAIDKIIKINNELNAVYYSSTFSEDGKKCLTVIKEFENQKAVQKILIEFDSDSAMTTDEKVYDVHNDKILSVEYDEESDSFIYHDNGINKEIKSLKSYNGFLSTFVGSTGIDDNRIAVILPTKDKQGYLGYYKFAIIDIDKDEITQECKIN